MKKLLTLVVLLSAMTLTARAQGVHFGVKGGIDVTDMSFSEKVFNTSNRLGWFIGPSLQIEFPMSGFGIDIAGLYDQKSTEVNDQTIKMKSVLVPLNLHFRIGFGRDAGIYLAAGPQFGFNVGDDDGFVFSFQPYDISCFAAGTFHFTIPYKKARHFLTPRGKWCVGLDE